MYEKFNEVPAAIAVPFTIFESRFACTAFSKYLLKRSPYT